MHRQNPLESWEPVIGLEIHAQLNTKTKVFSPAPNAFGSDPNTNISYTCTAQPGSLPVLNREVVKKALQFGLAIGAKISLISTFDRKSYFYPDSPRGFQITQFENPILKGGEVHANGKTFQVRSTHIEDDAGMLKHFSQFAGVDFNRAGAPLIEIVSEPCFHSARDAISYAKAIRAILLYLGVSDGNMEEGSLRIDANISVRLKGESEYRPRIEIKNMNSFSFMEMAIDAEIKKQVKLYLENPEEDFLSLVPPGTYRWDPQQKQSVLMRSKESAEDYRYFPEPDLPPLVITEEYIDRIRAHLPELPYERYKRYVSDLNLPEASAETLIDEKSACDYFESALKTCTNPKLLCNWIIVEFMGRLKEISKTFATLTIPPQHIAKLINMIDGGKITGRIAKSIATLMMQSPEMDPEEIVSKNPDFQVLSDEKALEKLVDRVLKENPSSIEAYRSGRTQAFGFLVGSVMKLTKGQASPEIVNRLLKQKLEKLL